MSYNTCCGNCRFLERVEDRFENFTFYCIKRDFMPVIDPLNFKCDLHERGIYDKTEKTC